MTPVSLLQKYSGSWYFLILESHTSFQYQNEFWAFLQQLSFELLCLMAFCYNSDNFTGSIIPERKFSCPCASLWRHTTLHMYTAPLILKVSIMLKCGFQAPLQLRLLFWVTELCHGVCCQTFPDSVQLHLPLTTEDKVTTQTRKDGSKHLVDGCSCTHTLHIPSWHGD